MSIKIEIPRDLYNRLLKVAKRHGELVEEAAEMAIEDWLSRHH